MKEFTCIVCPNGCSLRVEEKDGHWEVSGNQCKRGETFAIEEMTHPMRTICSTVRTVFPEVPVIPVRVSMEIPKERIFDVMKQINQVTVDQICGTGDVVIENVLGLGVDVIVTSDILKEWEKEQNIKRVCQKGEYKL